MSTNCIRCHNCGTELRGSSLEFCCQNCDKLFCGRCGTLDIDTEGIKEQCKKKICRICDGTDYKRSDSEGRATDSLQGDNLPSSDDVDSFMADQQVSQIQEDNSQKTLNFENDDHIWYPPVVDGIDSGAQEDLESVTGHTESEFSYPSEHPIRTAANDRLQALVGTLLRGYNIDWLETVTNLAWEAATFIEPDTSTGSMDPRVHVKIKCVASGVPNASIFIKGIICSKNINNKKLNSLHKHPKLMLIAESRKHQRVASQLAFFDNLLQEENDHLKMLKAQIQSLSPDIILVEKSVTSYVQQYRLETNIPLVLNMKRPLLERIAHCTGAQFFLWGDCRSTPQVGQCEMFRTETVMEQQEGDSQQKIKTPKTLMYFEGCLRPLGCTVLLRGSSHEELKKVKQVVKHAIFAAYHLWLETILLAHEAASLPNIPSSSIGDWQVSESQLNLSADSQQSILVFFSSRCVSKSKTCERSRPIRIKFSEHFDKTLGTYLKDEIFTQTSTCGFCKKLVGAHMYYYTHQNERLAINVKLLTSKKLPGEEYGKIWMWHRCQKCDYVEGLPPAGAKIEMSDAALRLSFGKFLQLRFSNHATAHRVAPCGHSIQRDCLQFFGHGSMVAVFRHSPIDILSIHLPISVPEFSSACPIIGDTVIPVFEDDPGSAISYALNSRDYSEWIASRSNSMASGDDTNSLHFTITFNDSVSELDSKLQFSVRSFCASQFESLRKNCCEVDIATSLKQCKQWNAQGGKSSAYFAKSVDDRLIIKEVVKTELRFFKKFARDYFNYVLSGHSTCITKILGIYKVSVKKASRQMSRYYMVMDNIFYDRKISKIYDLKGSERSRYSSGENKVFLDMNLLEEDFIFVERKAKWELERAIWNDTLFLSVADVMDYSLLVGVDEQHNELVVGIIDYLRQFSLSKRIESIAKSSGVLGGPRKVLPTIIPPEPYKNRFRKAISRYLVSLPL